MPMGNNRLLLFDGNALIHRAYHAMPPLTIKKTGENVGAVYGFMSMFIKTVMTYLPEYVAFTFDKKGPTFRKEIYPEYKANRPKAADDLVSQIIRVRELVESSGMAFYEADGFEADDVIGTIVDRANKQQIRTLIVTGDADAMQLVGENTVVLYPAKGNSFAELKEYGSQEVKDKYGVSPNHIADLKAMSGDSSDNIPGIVGIGPKTASSLIERFGSVENICQNMELVEPKRARDLLSDACGKLALYKKLCVIRQDVPVEIDFSQMRAANIKSEKLQNLMTELDFNSLLPRLNALHQIYAGGTTKSVNSSSNQDHNYRLIQTDSDFKELTEILTRASFFALSLSTDDPNTPTARPSGLSFAVSSYQGFYLPLPKDLPLPNAQISMFESISDNQVGVGIDQIRSGLNPIFAGGRMCGHNVKFNLHLLRRYGFILPVCDFDTMLAAYLLGEANLGLPSLVLGRLGQDLGPMGDLLGKSQKPASLNELDVQTVSDCSCAEADYICRLKELMATEINQAGLGHLYYDMELSLMPILFDMEEAGIQLDVKILSDLGRKYDIEINRLTQEIYDLAGHPFNIASPQQLAVVLYDELGLPSLKHTQTGRSTDAGVLEEIGSAHPIVPLILTYRGLSKIKSTYIEALPKLVSARDGRLHTTFNQTGTVTGRLSSSDPNLQNIPVREEGGMRDIRNAFVAKEGCLLLSADYSQIDLRVLAHLSQDSALIASFLNNDDIHAATASRLFEVDINSVGTSQRRLAKTVNFGVMYGMSSFGLEKAAKLSRPEANSFIKTYFEKYPAVSAYFAKVKEETRQKGYVQTLFGRRRYISDINSPIYNVREAAERMAINMPVQGTSADIIKMAMIDIFSALQAGEYQSRILLQVHDELILECPINEVDEVAQLVKDHMKMAASLAIPLVAEAKIGSNWGEMSRV